MPMSRVALLTGSAALVGAWLASAAGTVPVSAPLVVPPSAQQVAPAPGRIDLEAEVARLTARLERAPQPRSPGRNPFTLAPRQGPEPVDLGPVPEAAPAPLVSPAPPPVPRPSLTLAGIGSERTPMGWRHTAVLSWGGRVVLANVGDEVAGRYQLRALTADTVEVLDLDDDTTLRFVLP